MDKLRDNDVTISMTQSGNPTRSPGDENIMAERVFRTLKPAGAEDFGLRAFVSFSAAREAVEKATNNYNAMRLHNSIGYRPATRLNPHQAQDHSY